MMAPFSGLAIDMYAPSLPAISQYFHVSASMSRLTISYSIMGFGLGQFLFGGLTDSIGRKKPIIISLLCFVVFSLVAALTSSLIVFSIMRLLQGLCAAGPSVILKAINADTFEGEALSKMNSYYAGIWGVSPVLGPILGSYLQHYFHWQANFYVFTAIGLFYSVLALKLPETSHSFKPFRPITILSDYIRVLSHKGLLAGGLSIGIGYTCILMFSIVGPFFIIRDLGHSVIFYGHIAFFVGLVVFMSSFLTRFMMRWFHSNVLARVDQVLFLL